MTTVTLTHSSLTPNTKRVLCTKVLVSGKKNNQSSPEANGTTAVEVHTQSFENPKYVITGIHFKGDSDTLTYSDILTIYKEKYDGTSGDKLTLNVQFSNYDFTGDLTLVASDLTTTDIPVVMDTYSFPIDVSNSKEGHLPIGSINLIETK